ncbi:hypothetical protein K443DRAFT_685635 [Laccaria amethystina LaAM-08-1]|uniref:Uncharacterized protein n=1 Tax=Laccaria amethystina LaAM-08-1 TaxID=1095629 RepID=A0A0C9WU33_9AGAR|nr:hypothetical protein K443DRAFT_685635 [Laccaria amethystina LaAM-08-1]
MTSSPLALTPGFLHQVFRKNDLGLPQQGPCHVTNAAQGQRTLVVHRRFVVMVTFNNWRGTHSAIDYKL